jgi:hypothetical protein
MIDRIFRKTKTYLNTDGLGNFSPEDFNLFLHDAIQSRIEEYFPEITRGTNRQNRGLMANHLENWPDRVREKMQHYFTDSVLADDTTSTRIIPEDVRYIDEIEDTVNNVSFEPCENKREFNILKSQATVQYPLSFRIGNKIKIAPNNAGAISITYLRKVNYPKWTYQLDGNGNEFFNPSAGDFVDADIHASEEDEMVRRVLMRFGVNLKENQVTEFAMSEERQDFQENNQS